MHPRHKAARARPRGRYYGLATVLAVAALLIPTSASGTTLERHVVKPSNQYVAAECQFAVVKVYADHSVDARIQAVAQPKQLDGYYNNIHTHVYCWVYDSNLNLVQFFDPAVDGAFMSKSSRFHLDYSPYYVVCGQAYVKRRSGADSFTPIVCS